MHFEGFINFIIWLNFVTGSEFGDDFSGEKSDTIKSFYSLFFYEYILYTVLDW
jgi:hypothetical protein